MSQRLHELRTGPCRTAGRARTGESEVFLENAYTSVRVLGVDVPDGALIRVYGDFDGARIQASSVEVVHVPSSSDIRASSRGDGVAARDAMYRVIREHMHQVGFIEVETPVRVSAAGTDPFLEAVACEDETWLQTSPEFAMKYLLAHGHEKVFQICKAFRGKEITLLHNPEFTILEFYRAWEDMGAVMQDVEDIVKACVPSLRTAPFLRRTMAEVVKSAANIDLLACQTPDIFRSALEKEGHFTPRADDGWHEMFFELIVTCVDPYLAKQPPTFVTDWPSQVAVLARRNPSDPRVALRFELYVDGLELCNGFEELTDPVEQRMRFEEDREFRKQHDLPDAPMPDNFLKALELGLPPSAGVAVGLDRVLMLRMKTDEISDVLPFWWGAGRF